MNALPGRWAWIAVLLMLGSVAGCATHNEDRPFPENPEKAAKFNARLGAQYLRAGNLKRAREKLQRALKEDSDNVDAHGAFALLNMRLDQPAKARTHFRKALALEPDDPKLHNNFGTFLCDQEEYDAGIKQFLRAAHNKLYDSPAYAYANAGRCAERAGMTERARGYLDKSLSHNRQLPSALFQFADLEYHAGRLTRADHYLERYTRVAEVGARELWLGIRIAREQGDAESAQRKGHELIKKFPDSSEAKHFLETR